MKYKYQEKEEQRKKNSWADVLMSSYGPSKINLNKRFRMDHYGQQQEEKHTEVTYGRFIHW